MFRIFQWVGRALMVVAPIVLVTVNANAQALASISGTVKDASGAVLPGVTVEASSPALIEKTRSVVSDGSGQYSIVDLRPGLYTVTFALAGFNTVKREGIELTGSFTATVNGELKVGSIEESITVTGETPVVDLQSATKQRVITSEVVAVVPTSRVYAALTLLTPGVTQGGVQDVGGTTTGGMSDMLAHGSKYDSQRITQNGLTLAVNTGYKAPAEPNVAAFQEVAVDTASVDLSAATGGVRINFVPRDGGNTFRGTNFFSFGNHNMQGSNFDDSLKTRGLATPNAVERLWDINPGFGGPIRKDKIWFWLTARQLGSFTDIGNSFYNKNANNPAAWAYVPDTSRPGVRQTVLTDAQTRITTQVTPRNKVAVSYQQDQINVNAPFGCNCINLTSGLLSPEATVSNRFPLDQMVQADWTSPVTSKLLLEAVGLYHGEAYRTDDQGAFGLQTDRTMVSVTEQGGVIPGITYRAPAQYGQQWMFVLVYRAAMSYITGSHTFKVGFNDGTANSDVRTFMHVPYSYRFNNGVPNQLTMRTEQIIHTKYNHDLGIYAQDKWTKKRLTLNYGVRLDYFANTIPAQFFGPSTLAPTRNLTFAEQPNLSLKDFTPHVTAVYDLFGNGKTALKGSVNKYLAGIINMTAGPGTLNNLVFGPAAVNNVIVNTTRAWTDSNGNFRPDCDLLNPNAQTVPGGDVCGRDANVAFGTLGPGASWNPNVLTGWGHRNYNWEFSAAVQHEIAPRVSLDVGYFRRIYGNFLVTHDLNVSASDFTSFGITAPVDSRLPNGGGYAITGLYDVNPAKFGQPTQLTNQLSDDVGNQIEHWNGIDIGVNARLRGGLLLQGGTSTGRTVTDNCEIVSKLPDMLISGSTLTPLQYCHIQTNWLTTGKFLAAYTIPKIDVLVSGTLQSIPQPGVPQNSLPFSSVVGNYVVSNALVRPSLGRDLAAGATQNVTVNLITPGTVYGDRLNQVDFRVGKVLRFGRTRSTISLDVFNALNSNTVLTENATYSATSYRQPLSIVQARLARVSFQFDF